MGKDFKQFFQELNDDQQIAFAAEAITSVGYIKTHLIYGRKIPKPKLFNKLVAACEKFGAGISRSDLFDFFYKPDQEEAA